MKSPPNQLLIRSIIYLLAATSAVRGLVTYADQWQALLLVLVPFTLVLALEPWIPGQNKIGRLLYILIQPAMVAVLFSIARYADFWSLLLLPACYIVPRLFNRKTAIILLLVLVTVMAMCLWVAEEGWDSILFSSVYIVAYTMVWSFSNLILALEQARSEAVTSSVELAIANQKLRHLADQSAANASMQERTAVARELHDSVTQTLFSINLMLSSLEHKFRLSDKALQAELSQIQHLSDSAMKELRAIITQLRPTQVLSPSFSAQLGQLLQDMRNQHGLTVYLTYANETIANSACNGVLRIIKEALLNVVKHANVDSAEILFQQYSDKLVIEVVDHGNGFIQGAQHQPGHLGLQSMRMSSLEIGAQLLVASEPGGGTTITLELPLKRTPEARL